MEPPAFFLILTLITFAGHIHCETLVASQNPTAVGSTVTIFSNSSIHSGGWIFNGSLIVFVYPGGMEIDNSWKSRIIYNDSTSSLTIISTRLEDSGIYSLQEINNWTAKLNLSVQVPITAVDVTQTRGPAILNGAFTLSCEVTGPVVTILWWKDGNLISANNAVFGAGNSTLTLNPVQYSDGGNYQCQAFNLVSGMNSSTYPVQINYGPETPVIKGPNVVKAGDNVTLSCWAQSVPDSFYEWFLNGSLVSSMSVYVTPPFTNEMSGLISCMAFNNITGQNSTASFMPTVVDPITSVQILSPLFPAVEGYPYNLTCVVIGNVDYVYWMKNGEPLNADNMTTFNTDNETLMFMSLERSDSGNYTCTAVDAVGNLTSAASMLWVYYGPEMPTIMGSSLALMGNNVTLSCYADSSPPSLYGWYFNGFLVSNMSEYVTPSLTDNMSGTYTCMAFNTITHLNSSASMMLTVIDPIQFVQITGPGFPAIEGDPYELTCNTNGTVDNIYWMKNGKPLHADNRTVFDMNNSTVTFNPVEHSDTGHYKCVASNALEKMTSSSYRLLVNFGPETPIIHGPAFVETGSYAVLDCFAMSEPPSFFSWWFNGSIVSNTSWFNIGPSTFNMSGEYTCLAYNNVTQKNSTNSRMLTVIEAIQSVMIYNNTYPINQQNFTLTCVVIGPYDRIYWLKNGTRLSNNATNSNSSMYHFEQNMLYFTPLTMKSQGNYQCVATNKAAHHTSPRYTLLVYYGPRNLYISGPGSGKEGVPVSLTCSADSRPAADFYWFLNNQSTPLMKGSVITFTARKNNTGNYICEAKNPITNVTKTQSKSFAMSSHASATHFTNRGGLMFMGLCALTAHFLYI